MIYCLFYAVMMNAIRYHQKNCLYLALQLVVLSMKNIKLENRQILACCGALLKHSGFKSGEGSIPLFSARKKFGANICATI